MQRSSYRGVSTGDGVATACGHSTKYSTGSHRQIQIQGQMAAHSPPPAAHSPSRTSTPHYTIGYSIPARGGGATLLVRAGGEGVLLQSPWMNGGGEGGIERSLWAKEGLCTRRHWGTLTSLWPLGSGLGIWAVAFTETNQWHLVR